MLRVRFSPSAWTALLAWRERFPSGQREQTVNLPAYAFEGSNPSLSTSIMMGSNGECGNSSVGRARAFQARGRGFESRFQLFFFSELNRAASFVGSVFYRLF